MWLVWSCPNCSDDITLYENVTNIDSVADIFTGLMESNCTKPCNTTRVKSRFPHAQIFSVSLYSAISQTGSRGPDSRCECCGHYPWPQCAGDHHPPSDPLSLHPDVRWVLIKITSSTPWSELGGALGLWLGVGIMQLVQMTIEASDQLRTLCRHKQVEAHVKKWREQTQ